MYITVTITTPDASCDIQIDRLQRIAAAGEILQSTNKSQYAPSSFYRSRMQRRLVSSSNTFEAEDIQTGDELILIEESAA